MVQPDAAAGWRSRYHSGASPAPKASPSATDSQTTSSQEQEPMLKEATRRALDFRHDIVEAAREVRVDEISHRFRAPSLLLFGASACIIGFVFITIIGLIDFFLEKTNTSLRIPYKSGVGYFPATVSEMVHNQESPGGRVFHTFGMMSGVCIFLSWYPIHLRNVYTGADAVPCIGVYWTTARQLLPAMGLWLLIGVNTYPSPVAMHSAGRTKLACVALHLCGAGMMFLGYLVCELKCLGLLFFSPSGVHDKMTGNERLVRKMLALLIFFSFMSFSALQCIMVVLKNEPWLCCADEWKLKGDEVMTAGGQNITIMSEPEVVNTATGNFLKLKIASFVCEDLAGLSLVLSHLAIWYFCQERTVHYGKLELEEVETAQDNIIRNARLANAAAAAAPRDSDPLPSVP